MTQATKPAPAAPEALILEIATRHFFVETLETRNTVFVKGVVRRFHAASLISGALVSFSGLSQTGPAGCQLRVLPDQRCGVCAPALAWRGWPALRGHGQRGARPG